mgnify:FL=1
MIQADSELDAINTMMWAIGEAPVNSIENSGLRLVASARALLTEVSASVQEQGWHFNTIPKRRLLPDVNKRIVVGDGVVVFIPTGISSHMDLTLQGTELYDLGNDTPLFDGPAEGEVILVLPWDRLPRPAKTYITVRAARRFQDQEVGSETLNQFNVVDENSAYHALLRLDARQAGHVVGGIGRYGGPVVPPGFPTRRRRYG